MHAEGLERKQLRALVAELAVWPESWSGRVGHVPEQRTYELLHHDEQTMVWLISWLSGHDTGFHDHDLSSGAVAVVRGSVREERLRLGGSPASNVWTPGQIFDFEPGDIHRVSHVGDDPAVTLHAYSPPLARIGAYVEESGSLRRYSLPYAEELRPLEAAA